jgi:hypothetical protein
VACLYAENDFVAEGNSTQGPNMLLLAQDAMSL